MEDAGRKLTFLLISALGVLAFVAPTAQAARASSAGSKRAAVTTSRSECVVHSLPSFMDQGEEGNASSVADIIEVECQPSEYDGYVKISDQELFNRCHKTEPVGTIQWYGTNGAFLGGGPQADEVPLDNDGNATVVLIAGPNCRAGETTVVVDQTEYPFETYMTTFTVLPPEPTPEGVYATPSKEVESATNSSVATIIQVEFPVAETKVDINAEQLYDRCDHDVKWLNSSGEELGVEQDDDDGPVFASGRIESLIETDDDGNAFVVLFGQRSCQPGDVKIFADLEEAESFQTVHTSFEIESPRPTVERTGFRVEKEQKIAGEAEFTKKPLKGLLHQVVDYKVNVTNTGNTRITLAKIKDPNCSNIVGPQQAELGPNESTYYTCEHELTAVGTYINEAEVETTERRVQTSNKVEVEVPIIRQIVVEKEQKLASGTEFTKSPLVGALHETVFYKIIVTNKGNASVTLAKITDANCTSIVGPQKAVLAPGESTTYACEHELTTVGTYINQAEVETTEHNTGVSNRVEVETPEFIVEKMQRVGTSGSFTKMKLIGQVGQTVDYKIYVTNTGSGPVTLAHITDANCTNIVGPMKAQLEPAESTYYTCEHELTTFETWTNQATVESTAHTMRMSNEVEVEVPEPEKFAVVKTQRLSNGPSDFVETKLTGAVNETVYYRITVTNIGSQSITLASINDPNCTNIVAPEKTVLAPNESTYYACEQALPNTGMYSNQAEVEISSHKTERSNKVEVEVPVTHEVVTPPPPAQEIKGVCALSPPTLHGVVGSKRKPFTVELDSLGIKEVVVYLDHRKIKTLKSSQAKNGKFSLKINPHKLSYGPHKVSVTIVPKEAECATISRAGVFVHSHTPRVTPRFTG